MTSETGFTPDLTTRVSDNEYTFTQTTNISPDFMNTSSLQDLPVTYPGTNFGTNDNYEDYKEHRLYLIIGIAAAVGIIVLMCICMMIILLVICAKLFQNRRKKGVVNEIHSNPKSTLSPGYSCENCSLSFLPIDSTSRLNLLAFRRQEAARSMGSAPDIIVESGGLYQTNIEDMPDSDMYVEIPPHVHLAKSKAAMGFASVSNPSLGTYSDSCRPLKENSSYMVLHSANPEAHMYDEVPCPTASQRQPCEYEIPASSTPSCSSQPTARAHREDSYQADDVIYEEI